jgi:hypothetical protein
MWETTTQMPRQRQNAPGPAQEGSAPMQLLSTKRLSDALAVEVVEGIRRG